MLIDEVLAHRNFGRAAAGLPALSELRACHAFRLTDDAIAAADHLMATASAEVIASQGRLPYPLTWVEYAVDGALIGVMLDGRNPDGRTVALLAFVRKPSEFGVHAFGAFTPASLAVIPNTSPREYELDCKAMGGPNTPGSLDAVVSAAVMAMAALAVINSPALVEYADPDHAAINKKRVRNGKPPLIACRTVHLKRDVRQQLLADKSHDPAGVRLHWRRGHFKARKSGLYWWNAHLAGKKDLGMVEKDYVA